MHRKLVTDIYEVYRHLHIVYRKATICNLTTHSLLPVTKNKCFR